MKNFDLPASHGTLWVPTKEDDITPDYEKLEDDLEELNPDQPLYSTHEGDKFSVHDITFDDGFISMMVNAGEISVGLSIPVTPKSEFINLIDEVNRSLGRDLESLAQTYKCDDRGRPSLGSEYADEEVEVIILD